MRSLCKFWNQNRRHILIVTLGSLSVFLIAKYKVAWQVVF